MSLFKSKELKSLRSENEELKTKFHFMYEKEENAKKLEEVLKRLRMEVAQLNEKKNAIIREIESFEAEEIQKKENIAELDQKILSLKEMKDELQNNILKYSSQIQDIELTLSDKKADLNIATEGSHPTQNQIVEETKQKISDLNQEEAALQESFERKLQELGDIEEQKSKLLKNQQEISNQISEAEQKIISLEQEKQLLNEEIELKKKEIKNFTDKLNSLIKNIETAEGNIAALNEKEILLKQNIENLSEEEKSKSELVAALQNIDRELEERRLQLEETEQNFRKLSDETTFKQKELYAIDQSLSIKANRLSKLNLDILELDRRSNELKEEINNYETIRNGLNQKLTEEKISVENLSVQNLKLREIVPLLEKRKKEIEQSNAELENRFTEMFQKFNQELNTINKKRNVLEQIILKKEKDVNEQDQLLFEKIAALEESERVLNARQAEIESFENQIKILAEQKEDLKIDLQKIDEETAERKNYNNDLKMETDLLMSKRMSLEKSLQELLKISNDGFYKAEARKLKLNDELNEYEDKLQSRRDKLNESLQELSELQNSIGAIKVEQEEHKGNISKLVALKKRLHEEILKQQTMLQKFQKIREKLKIEQALAKNKQAGGPYMGGDAEASQKKSEDSGHKNAQIFKL